MNIADIMILFSYDNMSTYPKYDTTKGAWITSDDREFKLYTEAIDHENTLGESKELTLNNLIKVLKLMVPKDGDKKVFFDIVVGTEQPVRFRRLDLSKKTAREAFDKWYNDPKNRVKLSECASEF